MPAREKGRVGGKCDRTDLFAEDAERLPVDLFLGAHGAYFGMLAKVEKMKAGGPNPFIDPAGYKAYVSEREATFLKEWERQKQNPGTPAP